MAGGRPLRIDWQPEDTVAALHTAARHEPDRHVALRLQALWRLRHGERVRDTARLLGVSERSLQLWVAWYRSGGLAAVRAHHLGGAGRPSRLSAAQEAALREHLASGAVHTAWDVLDWLAAQYQVTYQRKGIYSVLKRLGARPKVPRPSNPKSSAAVREAW